MIVRRFYMLGVIRFLLAFCVIAFHLTQYIPNLGGLAVNFFYVISGYLITLVLHETYGFKFIPFTKNRFLRLYPAYFVLAAISLLFALTLKSHALFHPSWSESPSFGDVTGNIFMFPWSYLSDPIVLVNAFDIHALDSSTLRFRLIPSTWSVGVEIACYFLLWLFCARSVKTTLITIAAAIGWHVYSVHQGLHPNMLYNPVNAAMLPFGLGSLAYHITSRFRIPQLSSRSGIIATILLGVAFGVNWKLSVGKEFLPSVYYYLNTVLAFVAVIVINKTRHKGFLGTIDKWLGDLAYPMFLGHYVFAFIMWRILGMSDTPMRGTEIFIYGSALTVIASIGIVLLVDRKVLKARNRVKESISAVN